MGRLRNLSGREVCGILSKHGFALVRQKGSHAIMQRAFEDSTITVPVPLHKEIRIGNSAINYQTIRRVAFKG